jgi:hypothetical protein
MSIKTAIQGLSLLATIALLGGCNSLVGAQSQCSNSNPSYARTWECIRDKVAKSEAGNMNNDLGVRYLAYGDMLYEKVQKKQLTDAEAKSLLAVEMYKGNSEYDARRRQAIDRFVNSLPKTTYCNESSGGFSCTTW